MNRSVLVVGGARGIGLACCEWFRASGDHVLSLDRADGHDAADPDKMAEALAGVAGLDIVVNAAGSVGSGGIEDCTLEEWQRVLNDNLTSAFVVVRAALPLMRRGGSIVLFSSINGRHGGNRLSGPAYAAAKAGVIGLTRHLAKDLADRSIRVNALAPGPVATPMLDRLTTEQLDRLRAATPLGFITEANEIAETVGWLCSNGARSVTGTVIDVNGGAWIG